MISRTAQGVVVARKGNRFTILLTTGNKITATVKHSSLKRGSKCHVSFDNSTGKIVTILDHEENSCDVTTMKFNDTELEDITPNEIGLIGDDEERECSRKQKDEDWEHEELELWSFGVFSETEE